MRATFKSIIPKLLPPQVFQDAFEKAAREMEKDVKGSFEDATASWKHQPVWRGYVRLDTKGIYISMGTQDPIFGYVDQGTEPHIIKPVNAKVLHWVSDTGEDVFAMSVNHPGYKGAKISEGIQAIWVNLMPEYFDKYLALAIKESGHAI